MAGTEHRNALPAGYRVHWYEIERVLGQGGFGITYLARDSNLDQAVAIKEYLPIELAVRGDDRTVHPVSEERGATYSWGLDRFLREGQTLAKFKHPNIVRVLSLFEANNTGYMVMEYERGATLEAVLRQRRVIQQTELLEMLLSLLDGLEQVHKAGFIHRDIKPANILIRSDGTPVLIDFGSARQAFAGYTRTLTILVSPGYAPFEQYSSKGEKQGPWTDIYALAATMHRAVAGKIPADAIERNVVLQGQPDPLRAVAEIGKGWYSQHFLEAIDRGLHVLEQDRPQNLAEWRDMVLGKSEIKTLETASPEGATTLRSTELLASAPTLPLQPPAERPPKEADVLSRRRALQGVKWAAVTALTVAVIAVALYQLRPRDQGEMSRAGPVQVGQAPQSLEKQTDVPGQRQTEQSTEQQQKRVESQARREAERQRQAKIDGLLAKAEQDMAALRLTNPTGSNALERYRAILALDPTNQAAQQGLNDIVSRYVELVARAGDAHQFEKAQQYLHQAEAIESGTAAIRQAREQLVAKQTEVQRQAEPEQRIATPAQAQREAERQRQAKIDGLLAKAKQDMAALRLARPKGNNALTRFRQVQALDSGNKDARKGIAQIVNHYLKLADNVSAHGEFEKAERYLNQAQAIAPESVELRLARALITERKRKTASVTQKKIASAPKAKPAATEQQLQAGLEAYKSRDYTQALRLLKPLAEQGEALAQINLGLLYANGRGVARNDGEAVKWFRKSAEQGEAIAQNNLAIMYESGRGVPRDYNEAVKWYRKAAAQGHKGAGATLKRLGEREN